ncbi:MAG: SPASM domain-containing protein [Planctomycetes bacterium]|nr:SPASM domain-containing protein [Planctomycetota bacterium]
MRAIDRITEGERERALLERLRSGAVTAESIERESLPFFSKIQIQTTTLCNAACTTCPYPETSRQLPMGEMTAATFERILAQMQGRPVERVSLFLMNEPTVDRRLEHLTRLTRAAMPAAKVTIITNGKLLDGDRARALAAAGMGEITISVNGFDARAYGATMQGLRFDRILRNLEEVGAAWRNGELTGLDLRITALDLGDAARLAPEFAARIGIPVFVKPVTNRAGSVDTTALGVACPTAAAPRGICQRPFVKAYVLYNGDMVLCNCDWQRSTIFGNVHDTTLEAMWRGAALMAVRRDHLRGTFAATSPCARCDYPYSIDA